MSNNILESYGASGALLKELKTYFKNHFSNKKANLKDEGFVSFWREFDGSFESFARVFPEINFPISESTKDSPEYIKAVEEGVFNITSAKIDFEVSLLDTPAGAIPTIKICSRASFERFIQSISHENTPKKVPSSMGAAMFSGYPNWERVKKYKRDWFALNPGSSELDWAQEFDRLTKTPSLYQDSFIVLSCSPYSNVSHKDMALSEDKWRSLSGDIRKYHEVTHYYLKRSYGDTKNHVFDEVLCDFAGIVNTFGKYSAEHALKFLGLENYPEYRLGGRLENYLEGKSLEFSKIIRSVVFDAINNIARAYDGRDVYEAIDILSQLSILEIAAYSKEVKKRFS